MTASSRPPDQTPAPDAGDVTSGEGLAASRAHRAARIRGVVFAALGVLAFYFATGSLDVAMTFSFWVDRPGGELASVSPSVGLLWIITGLAAGLVGVLQLLRGAAFRWRVWLLVVAAPWIAATFAALLVGKSANLTGLVASTLELSTPLMLGAMAGILSERSGIFNIALEGKMLVGALVAAIGSSVTRIITGNDLAAVLVGVFLAMLASGLLGLLLAWLGIRHRVDQIIAGTVINIGAVGITSFIFLRILSRETKFNQPATVSAIELPFLSDIPFLGPMLFASRPYVYVGFLIVAVLTYMLFRTRWGLRLRASGEKPAAAGTVGVNVLAIRYQALLLAGLITGLAGSYLSLATAGSFQIELTAGKGFIALAAMIFGAWHPVGALGAALVFGFTDASQTLMSVVGVQVPPQILSSIPYVITIVVVAGVVGRVRGPAEAGRPYEQG
jgi:general nucleoside transport system permease protein